jgi:hypothetical protein
VRSTINRVRRMAVALFGALAAVAAFSASPAAAATCSDMLFEDRSQGPANVAGVIYSKLTNEFQIYDNARDGAVPYVQWNYSGVNDRWKVARNYTGVGTSPHSWFMRRSVGRGRRSSQICYRILLRGRVLPGTTRRYTA